MDLRIRVGVLIFKDDKLLLVRHVDPRTNHEWWVPPGGGIQGRESIFDAAIREVHEETNLHIVPGNVVYVRQLIYDMDQQNNADFYVLATLQEGDVNMHNLKGLGGDEHFIKELRYVSEEEIQQLRVFPKALKTTLWRDREAGFPQVRFLGVQKEGE